MKQSLIAAALAMALGQTTSPPRPNVVLVVADDLGYGDVGRRRRPHLQGEGEPDLWENDHAVTLDGYFEHEVTNRAVRFITDHGRDPFFLEVGYGWPHWPFQSPHHPSVAVRRNNSMFQQAADPDPPSRKDYVDIVEDADEGVGRILDAIDRRQLAQNTLVI